MMDVKLTGFCFPISASKYEGCAPFHCLITEMIPRLETVVFSVDDSDN